MNDLEERVVALERTFVRIQNERMSDVPILNPALRVQAIGFMEWQRLYLGILITPWFMNIMLLSGDGDKWRDLRTGQTCLQHLPSGDYEFLVGEESGIGKYQACSLFSPVFEFDSHDTAVTVAEKSLESILRDKEKDPDPAVKSTDRHQDKTILQRDISRRDLLRGRLSGEYE